MAKDPESLERFASGSGDGVVKVWYVPSSSVVSEPLLYLPEFQAIAWHQASNPSPRLIRILTR